MMADPRDPRAPQRPLLGFLFAPRPPEPGGAQRPQVRWIRIPPRGPWRLAFLILATLALVTIIAPILLGLAGAAGPGALLAGLGLLVLLAPAIALLVRGWIAGTYVNDAGLKVTGILRTAYVPWSAVAEIHIVDARVPLLGLPVPVRARRLEARTAVGERIPTLITSVSPDLAGRPQAWDASVDRLRVWHDEAGSA